MGTRCDSLIISAGAPDPITHFPDLGCPFIEQVYKFHQRGEHAESRVCGYCQTSSDAATVDRVGDKYD